MIAANLTGHDHVFAEFTVRAFQDGLEQHEIVMVKKDRFGALPLKGCFKGVVKIFLISHHHRVP